MQSWAGNAKDALLSLNVSLYTSRKNIGNEKKGVGMAVQKVMKQGRMECV